jgi:hypothetical protein
MEMPKPLSQVTVPTTYWLLRSGGIASQYQKADVQSLHIQWSVQ